MPFTAQVTAVFAEPRSAAVNCCVPVTCTEVEVKLSVSEMLMPTAAEADFVVSAWLVAVMVTFVGVGTIAGAV
jgi:hypothetical protein